MIVAERRGRELESEVAVVEARALQEREYEILGEIVLKLLGDVVGEMQDMETDWFLVREYQLLVPPDSTAHLHAEARRGFFVRFAPAVAELLDVRREAGAADFVADRAFGLPGEHAMDDALRFDEDAAALLAPDQALIGEFSQGPADGDAADFEFRDQIVEAR